MSTFVVFYYVDNDLVYEHELKGENLDYVLATFGYDVWKTNVVELDDDDTVNFCWYMKNLVNKELSYITQDFYNYVKKKSHDRYTISIDMLRR